MAMVTRYFDINPVVTSLGYGIMGDLAYKRRKEQEEKEREKRRRKNWTVGAAAVGTALTAGLAAPALGLAGTAAATEIGTAGAAAAGGALAIPATAGILGTGGVVGLGGYLTAGALGAQAGSMFADDNIAGGLGALASPFVAQQQRNMARQDRMGEFREMEGIRTAGDIRKMMEAQNIKEFGGTSGQISSAAAAMEAGMPAAGTELFPRIPDADYAQLGPEPFGQEAVTALGPPKPNMPGPGPIPNTKYDWNPAQNAARMKVLQRYSDKVDNPNQRSKYTLEERQMLKESAERELGNIRVQLMPDQPKTMLPGPGGKDVPGHQGVNIMPDGSKAIIQPNGEVDYRDAPKDFTKNFTADWTPEQTQAFVRKQVPDYDKLVAEGHRFFTQPDGKIVHIKPETDGSTGKRITTAISEASANENANAAALAKAKGDKDKTLIDDVRRELKPTDPVEILRQNKVDEQRMWLSEYSARTMTMDEYVELGKRVLAEWGNDPKMVPPELAREVMELGWKLRGEPAPWYQSTGADRPR
jgi:hypothetical protein